MHAPQAPGAALGQAEAGRVALKLGNRKQAAGLVFFGGIEVAVLGFKANHTITPPYLNFHSFPAGPKLNYVPVFGRR